jgi:hypothetical protein
VYPGYNSHAFDLIGFENNVPKFKVYDSSGGIYYQIFNGPIIIIKKSYNNVFQQQEIDHIAQDHILSNKTKDTFENRGEPEVTVYGNTGMVNFQDLRKNKGIIDEQRLDPEVTITGKTGTINFDNFPPHINENNSIYSLSFSPNSNKTEGLSSTDDKSQPPTVTVSASGGGISIRLSFATNEGISIEIDNLYGQRIISKSIHATVNSVQIIDIPETISLSSGTYLVRITVGSVSTLHKLIIVR